MSNHVKRHDLNVCKVGCSPLAFVVDSGAQCVQLRVEISETYSWFKYYYNQRLNIDIYWHVIGTL